MSVTVLDAAPFYADNLLFFFFLRRFTPPPPSHNSSHDYTCALSSYLINRFQID